MKKRMVAYNAYEADEVGIIWCMVFEGEAGYRPMTGRGELASPWYLARWKDHDDPKAAHTQANYLVRRWNKEQGHSPEDVAEIVTSSMAAQQVWA